MSNVKLEDCELITIEQYSELVEPRFIGQTIVGEDNMYYMAWESEGNYYKTHNEL